MGLPRILAKHACCEEKAAETLGKWAPVYKADEEKMSKPWAKCVLGRDGSSADRNWALPWQQSEQRRMGSGLTTEWTAKGATLGQQTLESRDY
jgi:hypothetical protein